MAEDRSERFDSASGPVFIQVFNPPFKLILIGAVHIAQPLACLGALAGYEILAAGKRMRAGWTAWHSAVSPQRIAPASMARSASASVR